MNFTQNIAKYQEQLDFISKFMTADPATGTIRYKHLTPVNFDNDFARFNSFVNLHGNGRELFAQGRDQSRRRVEYINGHLLRADIVAFYLYHGRLPTSPLLHLNNRPSMDHKDNLIERHQHTQQLDPNGKRTDLVKVIKDRYTYDPSTGTFTHKTLDISYFINAAEMNRYHAKANNSAPFTTIDSNGYHEETIFGQRIKAHIAAYVLMNGKLPDHQLTFVDRNRSNLKWHNITKRILKGEIKNV